MLSTPSSYVARVSLEVDLNRVDLELSWFPQFLLSGRLSRLPLYDALESPSLDLAGDEEDTMT